MNRFKPGDIVQHFKRELISDEERAANKYLYEIVGVAAHSETREPMMVYRPLYDDGGMYVRPLEMFLSEVDHEKYPDAKQKYRFEKAARSSDGAGPADGSSGHEYVDLGLSVRWATMNIGAAKTSDHGLHFAWGETEIKTDYTWSTYKHGTSADDISKYSYDDGRLVLEPGDDAAVMNWGGAWRMPTQSEWEELCNKCNCSWEWTSIDGTSGYVVTSRKPGYTDRSIFLPAAGYFRGQAIEGAEKSAYYWSSTRNEPFPDRALCLYFIPNFIGIGNNGFRNGGFTVRPVME